MQTLITGFEKSSTLADVYPPAEKNQLEPNEEKTSSNEQPQSVSSSNTIQLYDVVYAAIAAGGDTLNE